MTTQDYLAQLRAKYGITSDYAIAKLLGISKQAVGRYNKGLGGFDDEIARKVAAALDINPAFVMLDMHRERAKDAETRAVWQEIFEGFLLLLPHAKSGKGFSPTW